MSIKETKNLLKIIDELKEQLKYQTWKADSFEAMFYEACKKIPPSPGYEPGAIITLKKPAYLKDKENNQ